MSGLRENLIQAMENKKIGVTKLSKLSGVTQPTITRFKNGDIKELKAELIRKLAKALGTTEAALRGFEDKRENRLKNIIGLIEQLDDDQVKNLELFLLSIVKQPTADSRQPTADSQQPTAKTPHLAPRRGECQTSKDIARQRRLETVTTFQDMIEKHKKEI